MKERKNERKIIRAEKLALRYILCLQPSPMFILKTYFNVTIGNTIVFTIILYSLHISKAWLLNYQQLLQRELFCRSWLGKLKQHIGSRRWTNLKICNSAHSFYKFYVFVFVNSYKLVTYSDYTTTTTGWLYLKSNQIEQSN